MTQNNIEITQELLSDIEIKVQHLTKIISDPETDQDTSNSLKVSLFNYITQHTLLANQLYIMELLNQPKSNLILPK